MRNLVFAAAIFVCYQCTSSLCRAQAAADGEAGEEQKLASMKGKWGIGAGYPGVGIRYWVTDGFGIDSHVGFSWDDDGRNSVGIGGTGVWVLKKSENVRLLGLTGIDVWRFQSESTRGDDTSTRYNLGLGVGVEYHFEEMPELSFGAFATGIGIEHSRWTVPGATSRTATRVATSPQVGVEVRYYLN